MNKLFKYLTLFTLSVIFITNMSFADYDPILRQPLLTGADYYSITNDEFIIGEIPEDIDFSIKMDENLNPIVSQAVYTVDTRAGTYTPGDLSWKTSRIMVSVTFYNTLTHQTEAMGYQFKPTELIMANNVITTITLSKEQVVSGILAGMSLNNSLDYLEPEKLNELKRSIEYGFENGCPLIALQSEFSLVLNFQNQEKET